MSSRMERVTNVATILAGVSAVVVSAVVVSQALSPRAAARELRASGDPIIDNWEQYASGGHQRGRADAPVTIIEFGDYECPACRDWHSHIEAVLRKRPNDVRLIYRHWPLSYHQYAYAAARAAECANDQGKFWEYHKLLYENKNWLGDALKQFAVDAGVADIPKFVACNNETKPVPVIEADIAAIGELAGQGTPTILVNGRMLNARRDSTFLESLIDGVVKN